MQRPIGMFLIGVGFEAGGLLLHFLLARRPDGSTDLPLALAGGLLFLIGIGMSVIAAVQMSKKKTGR